MTDASEEAERIRAMVIDHPARHAALAGPALLPLIDPASWEGKPTPLRRWVWHGWIPCNQATLFGGAGGCGKSLEAQQKASHIALGRPFLGVETRQAVALYVTCEDDPEELQRRQEAICEALDVPFSALSGKLHLVSLAGASDNELCTFDSAGRMETTAAWERLRATALSIGAGFIVLDNVPHFYAGNENDRHQVAAFCGLMNRLAVEAEAAVLFIGHPNKAGDSFSGSTAWENQVRSRIFMERPRGEDGEVLDPDARVLRREKSNYARHGEEIAFRWHRWAFVRPEDMPSGQGDAILATVQMRREEDRFVACLEKATVEGRAVSHQNGINWAPKKFAAMPEAQGVTVGAFARAMERLFSTGTILADQELWRGSDRHWKRGLKLVSEVAGTPRGNPAETPAGEVR